MKKFNMEDVPKHMGSFNNPVNHASFHRWWWSISQRRLIKTYLFPASYNTSSDKTHPVSNKVFYLI
jgi:hypothetical protein